jgi:tetratricopeptide (TPR) repeat protein
MRFANAALARTRRVLAVTAAVLALAACGASTPRQASVERPKDVAPSEPKAEPAAPPAPATAKAEEPRRRDRGRGAERSDRAAAADATTPDAPVPEAAAAGYARVLTAMRAEDWLEAELELESLTAEYPAYPGPFVNLAIVYLHDERRDEARAALDHALAIDPGHAAANNELGILLREQGKFDAAEDAYRRALATDPGHALAHYNLGVLLDVYLRRTAEALEHYEIYQQSLAEPDETVGRWIIDLRRRVGNGEDAARVAQEDGQ